MANDDGRVLIGSAAEEPNGQGLYGREGADEMRLRRYKRVSLARDAIMRLSYEREQ